MFCGAFSLRMILLCFFSLQTRIRVPGKRRPPSRMARRLAAQEAEASEEVDTSKELQVSLPKQTSAVVNIKEPLAAEAESKENGFLSSLSLPAHSSVSSTGTNKLLPPESTENGDDLFESEDLFASSSTSRPAAQSKLKEGMPDSMANKSIKGREKKPDLGDQDSSDLFQPVQQKSSTKSSPLPFLEEEEDSLFTSQKTGKKELKSTVYQAVDPTAQDIFEVMAEPITLVFCSPGPYADPSNLGLMKTAEQDGVCRIR